MAKRTECLYMQLADNLAAQIKDGMYTDGSLFPSERELCEAFGVSRTTVRQALHELSLKGYTKSIHGKGTVVVHGQIRQELNSIYSFDEDMRKIGRTPDTKILDFVQIVASGAVASTLQLSNNEFVYRIMRLRLANDEPMLLETNYLPCSRFAGLTPEMLENRSLYRVLSSRYGFKATTAEETFEPVLLRPMEAQLLGVESHTLGLLIERISYEGNRPAEISKSVSPSSKFKPHVILNR